MYNGKIIDTHMHLCDLGTGNYSWLSENRPEQIEILGEGYNFLRKNFLPQDYKIFADAENIVGSVHLQYEADNDLLETQWLSEQAEITGIPSAIVAKTNLSANDAESQLAKHCESEYMRGIRMLLSYVENNPKLSLTDQNYFKNPQWQKNFALLKKFNLCFDVQLYDTQAQDLIEVAIKNPDTKIIINHFLWPSNPHSDGFKNWQECIKTVAKCPNIFIKISGAAVIFKKLDISQLQPYVNTILEYFGVDRCVVGSNYPPDGAFASFAEIWNVYRNLLSHLSFEEQEKIFYSNARKIYRI